jgi:hypothetical protein
MKQLRMSVEDYNARQARVKGSVLRQMDIPAKPEKGAVLRHVAVPNAMLGEVKVDGKKRKYRNDSVTIDGELFDSKREAARYQELKLMEKAGEIRDLRVKITYRLIERQDAFDDQPGLPATTYTPDFDYEEKFRGKWRRVTEDVKFSTSAKSDEKRKLKFTTAYQIFRIKVKLMRQVHGLIVKEV